MKNRNITKIMMLATSLLLSFLQPSFSANRGTTKLQSDANVLQSIINADKNAILSSVIAVNKKSSSAITHFANTMIVDHAKNMIMALQLADKMSAYSDTSTIANELRMKGSNEQELLALLEGRMYEKSYLAAMILSYKESLELIDKRLINISCDVRLKDFLDKTKQSNMSHLAQAKQLQTHAFPSHKNVKPKNDN